VEFEESASFHVNKIFVFMAIMNRRGICCQGKVVKSQNIDFLVLYKVNSSRAIMTYFDFGTFTPLRL
jgi:hypothetical protein